MQPFYLFLTLITVSHQKGEHIEGKWVLNIDTSKLTRFKMLTYLPKEELSTGGIKLLVSPTKVMVEFSSESLKEQGIEWKDYLSAGQEPKLVAFKGDESKELMYEGHSLLDEKEDYQQLVFDFGGYDAYDRFELELNSNLTIDFSAE